MASLEPPTKRARLLSESESSEDEAETPGQTNGGLKINEEYARRFEHNKKREEKHRLEEKYGKPSSKYGQGESRMNEEDEESSEDESEDDDGDLATKDLDDEIEETLAAIKRKDPRVYDNETKFYREFDPEIEKVTERRKEKPMSLHDYHRRNLMEGYIGNDMEEGQNGGPRTHAQEQEELKQDLVRDLETKMANGEASEGDDDFLVTKTKPSRNQLLSKLPSKKITDEDVAAANNDPESYLSNFMAARAWLPTDASRWASLESDESEDEKRADAFEQAYNLRFEDSEHANEKLMTFSRDANKYSVRREDVTGNARKRAREREREKKDEEKRGRQEERKRLRDLRVEEAAEKVTKIRKAAGLRGIEVNVDEWRDVLEGDFDDRRWEEEMRNRFGDSYYAAQDEESASEPEAKVESKANNKRKLKKPTWDNDVDINDLVPEFETEEAANPGFTLSSDDEIDNDEAGGVLLAPPDADELESPHNGEELDSIPSAKRRSKKDFAKEKADARRTARIERRKIEEMVDSNLPLEHPSLSASTNNKTVVGFRYRETSPTSFGMTARDILFADDSHLNQFAGLKKMAAFRDSEKKRKDKKRYSKKGRLREWRREVFGAKDEPTGGFEKVLGRPEDTPEDHIKAKVEGDVEGTKSKKRKRSKKSKQPAPAA